MIKLIKKEIKKEYDDKSKSESKTESKSVREDSGENVDYISVMGRLCAATPPSIIANRTPPHLLLKNIILLKNIKSIFA